MFDFEKEEQATAEEVSPDWENAEWEEITFEHADRENHIPCRARGSRRYQDQKKSTIKDSVRRAMLAIGLTVIGYLVRSTTWLAVTLGAVALVFGLISAYGAGKHSEM